MITPPAEKLIEAAYESYAVHLKPQRDIHTVIRETDVPPYFKKTLGFARGPRSRSLWHLFQNSKAPMPRW